MSLNHSVARRKGILRLDWEWIAVGAISVLAAFLRLYHLEALPPGVHFDEAVYGLQAEQIYRGHFPVFFEAYTGREPLYQYMVALVYLFTGPGTFGLRLTSSLLGIATVPAAYLALREMLGRRTALLAAMLTAGSYWHLNVTRTGFCWTLMPLAESIAIYLLWRGYRDNDRRLLALGGAATGANLYIYLAARFFPITLLLILGYLLVVDRQRLRTRWAGLALAVLAALLVFAPLGIHYLRAPHDFWERADQVLAWKRAGEGSYLRVMAGNALRMPLIFLPRLDPHSRYSLQGRPALDPLIGPFFILGLALALRRIRRAEYGALLLWWLGMALPPIFTIESFLVSQRIFGVIPAMYGLAAAGMDAAWGWAGGRFAWRRLVPAGLGLILVTEAAWNGLYYFRTWAPSPDTYVQFRSDMVEVARLMRPEALAGHRVVVASAHYRHPSAVITEPSSVDARWVQGKRTVAIPAWDGREIDYFVPIVDASLIGPALEVLQQAACAREEFANTLGDPVVALYRICRPPTIERPAEPLARFANEVTLWTIDLPATVARGQDLRVGIHWEVLQAVGGERCFALHLLDSQGVLWSQIDELGYIPPEWEPGDQVWQWLEVPVPSRLPPGTYQARLILAGPRARALPVHSARGSLVGFYVEAGQVQVSEGQRWVDPLNTAATALGPVRVWPAAPIDVERGPGERFLVEVTWQAAQAVGGPLSVELALKAGDGRTVARWSYPLADGYPASRWLPGEVVRQRYLLRMPPEVTGGQYSLWLSEAGQSEAVRLGTVRVPAVQRVLDPPPMQTTFADPPQLGGQVELLGHDLERKVWRPNEPLQVTLYWRGLAPMEVDYTVFVHLLGDHGQIVAQRDVGPAAGKRPTSGWLAGEVIADAHRLRPEAKWAPGTYRLVVGLYEQQTMARLEMRTTTGRVPDDRLLLSELEVR